MPHPIQQVDTKNTGTENCYCCPNGKCFPCVKRELMKDSRFRKVYETPDLAMEIANAVVGARIEKGWTQEKLAKRARTKQPAIARLERGNKIPSGEFLYRISKALDKNLVIKFE